MCLPIWLEDLRAAGLLHDIGKLDVSRELLYKAAQFTQEEYEEMQRHVERGVAAYHVPTTIRSWEEASLPEKEHALIFSLPVAEKYYVRAAWRGWVLKVDRGV